MHWICLCFSNYLAWVLKISVSNYKILFGKLILFFEILTILSVLYFIYRARSFLVLSFLFFFFLNEMKIVTPNRKSERISKKNNRILQEGAVVSADLLVLNSFKHWQLPLLSLDQNSSQKNQSNHRSILCNWISSIANPSCPKLNLFPYLPTHIS